MTKEKLLNYFLHKPGTFDDDDNKMTSLHLASESICKIEKSTELVLDIKLDINNSNRIQNKYNTVEPGRREGKFQWNKITVNSSITDNDLFELLDTSYDEILNTLPKEEQDEILDLEL